MSHAIIAPFLLAFTISFAVAAERKPVNAVLLEKFEAHRFKESTGHFLNYRLFKPASYDPRTNYPLVLFLHGAAGLGDDNARQFNGGNEVPPLALIADDAQARYPCFVLAPQCPRSGSWSSIGGRPSQTVLLTLSALDALKREFRIDPRRIYLVGVSMGGRGAWELAARFPRIFAAVIPICAAGDPAKVADITHLPIWCFHGDADQTVSVDYARKMIAALRRAGGNPKYTEYPGVGHDSYRNAFKEPDLLPWLFAQKRGN